MKLPTAAPGEIIAWCRIVSSAHGFQGIGELVLLADGRLLRRRWNDLGAPPPYAPAPAIDLPREIAALATAGTVPRTDTRIATIEVSSGLTTPYPRPLLGHAQLDHPADRLYAAVWDWP
ncbi:MAG: hypothetical protein ABI867_32880 [Kofleriaceae bacterium]